MNNSILKKCLDELQKDNPRKDYVIGMLETLIELQAPQPIHATAERPFIVDKTVSGIPTINTDLQQKDEGNILDAKAKARVDTIRELAEKSTEIS